MNLHQQFLQLAKEKQKITYKLLSLLPEIYKSGIYKQYTHTIYGYAWQFAQIPESAVRKTLNLEGKLHTKPLLKAAVSEVGIHKVAIVESLVSTENEEVIVEKIKNMSTAAIQTMAKEMRHKPNCQTLSLNISPDTQKLLATAKKLLNISDLSNDNAFTIMLEYIVSTKQSKPQPKNRSTSRHIPTATQEQVKSRYDQKCCHPNCTKNSQHIHHIDRYAESKSHKRLVPLCKIHHEFMHNSLIPNENEAVHLWKIAPQKTTNIIDLKYQKFRS